MYTSLPRVPISDYERTSLHSQVRTRNSKTNEYSCFVCGLGRIMCKSISSVLYTILLIVSIFGIYRQHVWLTFLGWLNQSGHLRLSRTTPFVSLFHPSFQPFRVPLSILDSDNSTLPITIVLYRAF